ncbi:MAG: tyrosine-type recombinase/integrase [Pyrinomonadaceae bacterium]
MNLGEARKNFIKGYFSVNDRQKKTVSTYGSDMKQFVIFAGEVTELGTLRNKHIEDWAFYLKEKDYSPASIRRKLVVLKVFFAYWVRDGFLTESPFWRVKISVGKIVQLPRTLTESEVKGLLTQQIVIPDELSKAGVRPSSRDFLRLRNNAIVELLFATGMRACELSAIDITDFKAGDSSIRIQGKGRKERMVYIVDNVTARVQAAYSGIRLGVQVDSPALFVNASGTRLSPQGIANVICSLRRKSGIERHITPHMLRHTVATFLLRNGVDIRIVQEFLGHASIVTTQRYTHVAKEHLISELQARHPSLDLRK